MIDASLAVQRAIYNTLTTDAGVLVTLGGNSNKIVDRVPPGQDYPYVAIGEDQVLDASDDCHEGCETVATLHIWSNAVGRPEAKTIGAAVIAALDADITIPGHDVIIHEVEMIRDVSSGDSALTHRVISMRYVTAPSA